jgi:hypothetical protein
MCLLCIPRCQKLSGFLLPVTRKFDQKRSKFPLFGKSLGTRLFSRPPTLRALRGSQVNESRWRENLRTPNLLRSTNQHDYQTPRRLLVNRTSHRRCDYRHHRRDRYPNLLASRRAANEGSAQSSLRTIHSSEAVYQSTAGDGKFGNLTELGDQSLIDSVLKGGTKSGYTFLCPDGNITDGPPARSSRPPNPADVNLATRTGNRSFTIAEDGILRGKVSDTPGRHPR